MTIVDVMPEFETRTGPGSLDRAAVGRYVPGRRTPEGGFCFVLAVEPKFSPDRWLCGLGARHRPISTLRATWLGLEAAHLFNRL